MLTKISDLHDFNDASIVVKGTFTIAKKIFTADDFEAPNNTAANATATNNANDNEFGEKTLFFKNNLQLINCTSKINDIKINNAEDVDVVMSMYNLLEYSKNYRKTKGSFWNYYRDESNSGVDNGITYSITGSMSFDHKVNFMADGVEQDDLTKDGVKIVVSLKYLSNFWRSLNIPLINCKIELILTWFKNCVPISKATREADYGADPIVYEIDNSEDATYQIIDTKLYVPVVTLSKENDIKLLEQLKSGFKRTIKWNKYSSQMTVQPQNNNLNYLIDTTFTNVNRLFALSFSRNNNTDSRYSSSNYYVPKVEINDFNVLIDGKSLFDLPVKNEKEAYEKIIETSNNNDYTTDSLLDFGYFKKITD